MTRSTFVLAIASLLLGAAACASSGDGDKGTAASDSSGVRACNGHRELCGRRFDEVAFPATHNSHAAQEYGYPTVNANQISGLTKQLEDGIRCMLIDVYIGTDGTTTSLCHGICSIAETPHLAGLAEIKAFLDANSNEVLTLIYEDHVDPSVLVADLETSGLAAMAFTHISGAPWPTLGEMIDAGTRLVVTAETAGPPPAWLHHVWDVAFDTPYTFMNEADFSCALNRGSADNDLFLVNHWISTDLGLPAEQDAIVVNTADVLGGRVTQCQNETGHLPNFVAVDFYEHGDLFAVVDRLNGLPAAP